MRESFGLEENVIKLLNTGSWNMTSVRLVEKIPSKMA